MYEVSSINPNKPEPEVGAQIARFAGRLLTRVLDSDVTGFRDIRTPLITSYWARGIILDHGTDGVTAEVRDELYEFVTFGRDGEIFVRRSKKTTVRSNPQDTPEGTVEVIVEAEGPTDSRYRKVMYSPGDESLSVVHPGQDRLAVINQLPMDLKGIWIEITNRELDGKVPLSRFQPPPIQ